MRAGLVLWAVWASSVCAMGCGSADDASGGVFDGAGGRNGGEPPPPPPPDDWPELDGFSVGDGEAAPETSFAQPAACADMTAFARVAEFVPMDANAEASATLALSALEELRSPVPAYLRTPEFSNHYAPKLSVPGDVPSVEMELRRTEIPTLLELVVAVQAPMVTRPQLSMTFVVDTSASIAVHLPQVREALRALSSGLTENDRVHWVTLSSQAAEEITATELTARAESLLAEEDEATADINRALTNAYDISKESFLPEGWNRVVFITDGEHVPSLQSRELMKASAMPSTQGPIHSLVLGVGPALIRDPMPLRALSHAGRGPYVHLRSETDASALAGRFDELVGVALDDVRLTLTAPWYFELERPYIWEAEPSADADPQYLPPSGRLLFPFRLRACDVSAIIWTNELVASLGYRDPASQIPAAPVVKQSSMDQLQTGTGTVAKAFAIVAYAEALRSLDGRRLESAFNLIQSENVALQDEDLGEILLLLPKHPAFPQ